MRIGLASTLSKRAGATWRESIDHLIWQAEYGDRHGYANFWLGEHHFTEWGPTDSPGVWLAHLAARTARIRLGYVVALVPFYHPVRLAEEMLLVDNLSHGRLDIGLGRGHAPIEVAALCVAPDRQADLFDDGFEVIWKAFQGEPFAFNGRYWSFPEIQLFPPPTRRGPDIYMVMTSPRSIEFAAAHGAIPIVGTRPTAFIQDQLAQYIRFAQQAGMTEERLAYNLDRVSTGRFVYVGRTHAEARQRTVEAITMYDYAHELYNRPVGDPEFHRDVRRVPLRELPDDELDARAIWGTRDEIIDRLRSLDAAGIKHVSALLDDPDSPPEEGRRRLEVFTREVLPAAGALGGG